MRLVACLLGALIVAASGGRLGTPGAQQATGIIPLGADKEASAWALLTSANPREQAWGAWHVRRERLTTLLDEVNAVVQQRLTGASVAEESALDSALDALIELNAEVAPQRIAAIYERRPTPALILASRVRETAIDPVLLYFLESASGVHWLAVANLLVARKPPGTAAALLNGLTLRVDVRVSDRGEAGIIGGVVPGLTEGCHAKPATPGDLPPLTDYRLWKTRSSRSMVLADGPFPVYYERVALSSCRYSMKGPGPRALDNERIEYLAALMNRELGQMSLHGREVRTLRWTTSADFLPALDRILDDVRQRYAKLIDELRHLKLLDPHEHTPPILDIALTIADLRTNRSVPLPAH